MPHIKTLAFLTLLIVAFSSCATLGIIKKRPLTMSDISGTWVGNVSLLGLAHCRLELSPEGTGYLVTATSEDSCELYQVKSIDLADSNFTIRMVSMDDPKDSFFFSGGTFGDQLFVTFSDEEDEISFFLIREADLALLESKAREIIEQARLKNPTLN